MAKEQGLSLEVDSNELFRRAFERAKSHPTRETTIAEKQPDGLWNFEHLSPGVEQLNELLEAYQLEIQHGSSEVWVATLLPYSHAQPIVSPTKKPTFLQSLLSKLMPAKIRNHIMAAHCIRDSMRAQVEERHLEKQILHGTVDGYYCARTGSYFQDCLEGLLENVKKGVIHSYHDAYKMGNCTVAGWAFASENDSMGQYLMKGKLIGSKSKDNGEVSLVLEHPTLRGLSARAKGFTEAYHILVQRTKLDLTPEQLLKATGLSIGP